MKRLYYCVVLICQSVVAGCRLYLAESGVPGAGFGVFAGRAFLENEVIEISKYLSVRGGSLFGTALNNFAFQGNGKASTSSIVLGSGSLCNHKVDPNVYLERRCPESVSPSACSDVFLIAKASILPGSELFVSYGHNSWFTSRGIQYQNVPDEASRPIELLKSVGVCLYDGVSFSSSPDASGERILLADQSVSRNTIVSVSPVLFLPTKRYENSELYSHLLVPSSSNISLLLIGNGAFSSRCSADYNAEICWYWGYDVCALSPDLLEEGRVSKKDLVQNERSKYLMSVMAVRDIAKGEEIKIKCLEGVGGEGLTRQLFSSEFMEAPYEDTFRDDVLSVLTNPKDRDAIRSTFLDTLRRDML